MKPTIPQEFHALASSPALPAIPAILFMGKQPISGAPTYKVIPPVGGHALLDLYFCAILSSSSLRATLGASSRDDDETLDEVTEFAWRLAISAVRTRPDTGPVPVSLPEGGL